MTRPGTSSTNAFWTMSSAAERALSSVPALKSARAAVTASF
jgi:hypothetical protein